MKNKNSFIPKKYLQPDRYNNVDGIWEAEYTDIKGEKYFVAPKIERGREDYYDEGGTNANTPGLVVYSESGRKGVYSDADGLPFTEPTKSYVQFMLKFETRLEGYCRNAGLQYLWYHGFNECQEYWETDLENGDVLFVLKVNGQNVWTGHVSGKTMNKSYIIGDKLSNDNHRKKAHQEYEKYRKECKEHGVMPLGSPEPKIWTALSSTKDIPLDLMLAVEKCYQTGVQEGQLLS